MVYRSNQQVLYHHGVLGQKWGIRRYQNPDGTLTDKGRRRLEKKDANWAKKKSDKITAQAKKQSKKELYDYGKKLLRQPDALKANGKLSAKTVNAYNQKMAELMSQKTSELRSPSGKVVSFVAKRGEVGVFMALSEAGYNPNQFKNGIYNTGRVAYRKTELNKINV